MGECVRYSSVQSVSAVASRPRSAHSASSAPLSAHSTHASASPFYRDGARVSPPYLVRVTTPTFSLFIQVSSRFLFWFLLLSSSHYIFIVSLISIFQLFFHLEFLITQLTTSICFLVVYRFSFYVSLFCDNVGIINLFRFKKISQYKLYSFISLHSLLD